MAQDAPKLAQEAPWMAPRCSQINEGAPHKRKHSIGWGGGGIVIRGEEDVGGGARLRTTRITAGGRSQKKVQVR